MEDDLNSHYDVIVLGTGLPECILAAAAARIGKSVLHLDKNEYYGGGWASFNLDGLKKLISSKKNGENVNSNHQDDIDFSIHLNDGELVCKLQPIDTIEDIKEYCFINSMPELDHLSNEQSLDASNNANIVLKEDNSGCGDGPAIGKHVSEPSVSNEEIDSIPNSKNNCEGENSSESTNASEKQWYYEDLERQWRKFNLDLAPKFLFAKGSLVELLISSNIARYAEFKSVTRILTYLNGKLEQVPCCRSDVFITREVTIVEKRMLMKFLNFCSEFNKSPEEYEGFQDKTFHEFLKARKMTPNVIHYIIHAIAMINDDTSVIDGLIATQRFLKSLGHYGNTPFLWTLYGSGELPQCFCRLCAVFGGVYCLKRAAEAIILDSENKCIGIISQNKRINCNILVAEASYLNTLNCDLKLKLSYKKTSHAMLITNQSILKSEKEQLTFFRLPPTGETHVSVTVIELGAAAMACPNDLYVVHLFCEQEDDAETDLQTAIHMFFDKASDPPISQKPKILWCLYYTSRYIMTPTTERNFAQNVFITSGANSDIDMDIPVTEAKEIFSSMFPEEEFLPRAPDPDEIIIDDPEPHNNPGSDDADKNQMLDSKEKLASEDKDQMLDSKEKLASEDEDQMLDLKDKSVDSDLPEKLSEMSVNSLNCDE